MVENVRNFKQEIKEIAEKHFKEYVLANNYKKLDDVEINIDKLYESVIFPNHEIILYTDQRLGYDRDQKILGKTIIKEKTILLDKSLNGDPRFAFTAGHEFGHGIIHKGNNFFFNCTESTIHNKYNLSELQANSFAVNLIMPDILVQNKFQMVYGITGYNYVGEGDYSINYQTFYFSSYQGLIYKLATQLTKYFANISKESMAYRLNELGLVRNLTNKDFFAGSSVANNNNTIRRMDKINFARRYC